jgi:hypothetical protein
MSVAKVRSNLKQKNFYFIPNNIILQKVFSIPEKQHGKDSNLKVSWQPKHGTYLASSG